ncbi:hypothetical protein DCC85_04990 [Paenibacillus sp. CAA11]|uniref:hypothetical protein n=1 Tax=Paenibacillus sp. CAA11 TaxID=1532905 RepID=UPI000D3960B7|nr:hypothetical protein [Paenibacillus sp. CAA11]AWB43642.1 hypothetical protein DCC85_04990 [Paenibacillus sp. CAA11]
MKQKIIIFLITSITYGMLMAMLKGETGDRFPTYLLIYGIPFGLIMTLGTGWIQHRNLKKTGNRGQEVKVKNVIQMRVEGSREEIFELCLRSLGEIKRTKVKSTSPDEGIIQASAGISWLTWGDVIEFQIKSAGEEHYFVQVLSRPAVSTTLIDYGKNLDNVQRILRYFKHYAKSVQVE